jgi:hypothetical protein
MMAIEPIIRGLLTAHGLKIGPVHRARFASKVEAMLADAPILRVAIEPLLEARNVMRKQRPCWISVSHRWLARITSAKQWIARGVLRATTAWMFPPRMTRNPSNRLRQLDAARAQRGATANPGHDRCFGFPKSGRCAIVATCSGSERAPAYL